MKLPKILDQYFKAQNKHDVDAMVACFATDATVLDEGKTIVGSDGIRKWKKETIAKYHISVKPKKIRIDGDRTIVVLNVSGDFEGSPVDLNYQFKFSKNGLIGSLEVH